VRTATFLISDGVIPANKNQGYVLRRLIRRAVFKMRNLESHKVLSTNLIKFFVDKYSPTYPNLRDLDIKSIFQKEEERFLNTLNEGAKEFEKGTDPFVLATTYGFPIELTEELAKEKGQTIDKEDFKKKMAEHQKLSQTSSAGMFKGGLANHNEKTIRLHTAHHLLLAALQQVVDKNIKQRGSNITEERLRIDFLCDHKLTDEEKKQVEDLVNEKIKEGLVVTRHEMAKTEAEKLGAEMEFGVKYADTVSVYSIGKTSEINNDTFSLEFCGGPHVKNTNELSIFKIQKEESVAQGIRRIKAVLVS
jgi:alanyl-tRNA synthetase